MNNDQASAPVIHLNSSLFEDSKRMISQNANAKIVFFDMALKIIVLLLRK